MRILQVLALIFGLTIFTNAQTESANLFLLRGKIIYQKIKLNEVVRIFFQDKDNFYQTKVNADNSFEIKLSKGIYQVEIIADNGFIGYKFENTKIGEADFVTFDTEKSSFATLYCPQITNDISIQIDEPKLSNEINLKPLQELPKAQNKTKRKINNNK